MRTEHTGAGEQSPDRQAGAPLTTKPRQLRASEEIPTAALDTAVLGMPHKRDT